MHVIRLTTKLFCLGFSLYLALPASANEVITLDLSDGTNSSTRLEENFTATPAHEIFLSEEPVSVSTPSRFAKLKKRLLNRELGPISLKLNVRNPVNINSNTLCFNLDLVESFNLLNARDEARSQLVSDMEAMRSDVATVLRTPFYGAARTWDLLKAETVL